MLKRRAFSLFLLLPLASCANHAGGAGQDVIPAHSLQEAQTTALAAKAYCPTNNCPSGVGLLSVANPTGAILCSATLIGPDLVLTASHCVPPDLTAPGSDCTNRAWINFPDGTQAGCGRVLSASTLSQTEPTPDYAFLQLKAPVSETPLTVSHDGFDNNGVYTAVKMDPEESDSGPMGYIIMAPCKAVLGSLAMPNATTPTSGIIPFGDCEIVHGNSGAPITDSSGAIRGIIQAIFEESADQKIINQYGKTQASLSPLGWATNMACVNVPGTSGSLPQACSTPGLSPHDFRQSEIPGEISTALAEQLAQFKVSADPRIQWTVQVNGSQAQAVPKCLLQAFSATTPQEIDLPTIQLSTGFDEYLRPSAQLTQDTTRLIHVTVTEASSGSFTFKTDQGDTIYNGALSNCSP